MTTAKDRTARTVGLDTHAPRSTPATRRAARAALARKTLDQVERLWQDGTITDDQTDEYIRAWNATPGRFNEAYRMSGAIRLRERK